MSKNGKQARVQLPFPRLRCDRYEGLALAICHQVHKESGTLARGGKELVHENRVAYRVKHAIPRPPTKRFFDNGDIF
jgi:hypothetical protein